MKPHAPYVSNQAEAHIIRIRITITIIKKLSGINPIPPTVKDRDYKETIPADIGMFMASCNNNNNNNNNNNSKTNHSENHASFSISLILTK